MSVLYSILILWFFRTARAVSFWLYLWQLKEYHIGRFLDHFQTNKGKRIIFNKLLILKIVLASIFFYFPVLVLLLLIVYFIETLKLAVDFFKKRLKHPVFTKKTILLSVISLLLEIIFIFWAFSSFQEILTIVLLVLLFDILTPLIVSLLVLLFQPLAVFGRYQIIKKARLKRDSFKNLIVVGITGSYGKTSTKEFLAKILSKKYKVLKTKEHQNSEVGISRCILEDLNPEHQVFVCEMGAYNKGGIKLLCSIAKPKIGVLTGINEQHMSTFGSQENIIKGKYELIESLPEDGIAFFNAQNQYCQDLYGKTNLKKFLYAETINFSGEENILGAVAVARELGLKDEEINSALTEIKNKFGGIKIKEGIQGLKIIDASYSANPQSVIAHLEYIKNIPGKKIIIMPCLIELGQASKEVHRRIGQKIAQIVDLAVITTKDRFKEIKDGSASSRQRDGFEIVFMENPKKILEKVMSFVKKEDIVLLESRVPEILIKGLINKA